MLKQEIERDDIALEGARYAGDLGSRGRAFISPVLKIDRRVGAWRFPNNNLTDSG